jgi:uncharacterized protein YaaR (DUF327 family)
LRINSSKQVGKVNTLNLKNDLNRVDDVFEKLLEDKEHEQKREHFYKQLDKIKKKGKELSDKKTIELLIEYKDMISSFVKEAVEYGLRIEQRRGSIRTGRNKITTVVTSIDKELLELTDEILSSERKNVRVLAKIGQIQGLLVNLII